MPSYRGYRGVHEAEVILSIIVIIILLFGFLDNDKL